MSSKIRYYIIGILAVLMSVSVSDLMAQGGNVGLRTIVIDPGHGGKDPGAPGPDSRNSEKHIVLKISRLFGEKIRKEYPDVKVVYTRNGDTYPKLTDRIKTAHAHNADLFISIHCNSVASKTASGSSAHILSRKDTKNPNRDLFDENVELTKLENSVIQFEEDQSVYKDDTPEDQILNTLLFNANYDYSVLFAHLIVEHLAVKPFHKWGRGIHQNDFHLLKKMTCPAVLVETAFLSNANERQLLISDKWQEEIAERLFKAFKEYKSIYDGSVTTSSDASSVSQISEPQKTGNKATAATAEVPDEYYGIQIMGLGRLIKNGDPSLKGLSVNPVKAADSNIYKYVYGTYTTAEKAKEDLSEVRKKFPEAFVVKVKEDIVTRAK